MITGTGLRPIAAPTARAAPGAAGALGKLAIGDGGAGADFPKQRIDALFEERDAGEIDGTDERSAVSPARRR
jgi:hypothetical protein